jgi:hypothetical protein
MSDYVLLVFEGEKTEPKIFKSLQTHYFNNAQSTVIRATYDAEIYQLWRQVAGEEHLDLVEEIRNRNDKNTKALAGIKRDQVSQIFLFFDYDGHATSASDEAIAKMLSYFNNENNNGKLYISYPMVEAFKHIKRATNFRETTYEITKGKKYKNHVDSSTDFPDIRKFNKSSWNYIILENCKKANLLVRGVYRKPSFRKVLENLKQEKIFDGQRKHHIIPHGQVAVLSAFPFFIIEYFGENAYSQI